MAELSCQPIMRLPHFIMVENVAVRLSNYTYPDDISAAIHRQDGFIIVDLLNDNNDDIVFRYLPSAIDFVKEIEDKHKLEVTEIHGFSYAD